MIFKPTETVSAKSSLKSTCVTMNKSHFIKLIRFNFKPKTRNWNAIVFIHRFWDEGDRDLETAKWECIERRPTFTSVHRLWMHTHFLLASKSVEHTASVKRRRNNNNNNHHHHQHRNIKGLILLSEFLIAAVFVYAQRAHMRSHSLWFSFLAFCFRFVRLSVLHSRDSNYFFQSCSIVVAFDLNGEK